MLSKMLSTGFAGASAAHVLDDIDPLATPGSSPGVAAKRLMAGCDFPRQRLKSQIQTFTANETHLNWPTQ
jgi:hypothetical protein